MNCAPLAPIAAVNCEKGYINIQLNDSYILQRINELAREYKAPGCCEFYPDDSEPTLYRDYMMYLANAETTWEPVWWEKIPEDVRQVFVSIVYGDFTGNVEKIPEAVYFFARQGTDPRLLSTVAKAGATIYINAKF